MNKSFKFAIKTLILGVAVLYVVFAFSAAAQNEKVCTQEAKQCPDGSYVSRTGPNCEFAACPGTNIKEKRAELINKLKDEREAAKKHLEAVREEAKKAAEARQLELKDKIGKLHDEKKKQAATRLNEQLAHLNTQWTSHFNNVLDQLESILAKIEIRSQKAESNGGNVSTVKAAIETARAAIKTARDSIAVQAAKIYTVTFNSEDELKDAFKTVKEQLRTDLTGLRDGAVKDARKAAQDVFQVLRQIPKVDQEPIATSTPIGPND